MSCHQFGEAILPPSLRDYLAKAKRLLAYRQITHLFANCFPKEFKKVENRTQLKDLPLYQLTPEESAFFKSFADSFGEESCVGELMSNFIDEIESEICYFSQMSIPWYSYGLMFDQFQDYRAPTQVLILLSLGGCLGDQVLTECIEIFCCQPDIDASPLLEAKRRGLFEVDPLDYQAQFRQLEPPLQYVADAIEVCQNPSGCTFLIDPEMEYEESFAWTVEDIALYRRQHDFAIQTIERMYLLIDWLEEDKANYATLFSEWFRIYEYLSIKELPLLMLLQSHGVSIDDDIKPLPCLYDGDLAAAS